MGEQLLPPIQSGPGRPGLSPSLPGRPSRTKTECRPMHKTNYLIPQLLLYSAACQDLSEMSRKFVESAMQRGFHSSSLLILSSKPHKIQTDFK